MQHSKQNGEESEKDVEGFLGTPETLTAAVNWEDPSGAKGHGGRTAGLFAHAWLTCPGLVMSHEQTQ